MTAWTLEHHDGVAVLTFRREPANWMDLVSMGELADHYNAEALVASYIEGLENAAQQAPRAREDYIRILQVAAAAARNLRRD